MGSATPPESQQQYCLRWNNYQNNLTNVFDQLLQAEAFVDVTLSAEGHSLKAHKVVLCACSPYFQALFFDNPCKHPIVILNGVKWTQLKALTEFMYRGEINVAHDQLAPLLKVAELLKIRGLADVSHSRSSSLSNSSGQAGNSGLTQPTPIGDVDKRPNPADFLSNSNHSGSGCASPAISVNGRKRRKMSSPERTPSPGSQAVGAEELKAGGDESNSGPDGEDEPERERDIVSMSVVNPLPSDLQRVLAATNSAAIGPALLNLHAAAAAMAGTSGSAGSGSLAGNGGNAASDLDIKPGIVEMIREEERAKMLESAHGWLGPGNSSLSESYQYQIQNLWQKCWNQNQGGMMHALRFRERGPLKSWRPETMAEAIFAVLREGLSLSQAARKFDIPYPTFVLYANRVHNMLGPSADGSSSTDLMSDMRPKGRGRPQRILLGSWPEDHIRSVIRAVVFRDTQSKDDVPFVFNRDGSLCLPQPSGSTASTSQASSVQAPSTSNSTAQGQNGVELGALHSHFFGSNSPSGTPAENSSSRHSNSSSNSSSPLQQALSLSNISMNNLQAAAQSQLLAFNHFQKVQAQIGQRGKGSGSGKGHSPTFPLGNLAGFLNPSGKEMKELFQIKSELGYDQEGDGNEDEEQGEQGEDGLSSENHGATDLSRTSPEKDKDKANNNEKDGDDLGPVAVVQVQMEDKKLSSPPR